MAIISLNCGRCGGRFYIDDNKKPFCFCVHCGNKILFSDGGARYDADDLVADGLALWESGKKEEANAVFLKAISADPDNWPAWVGHAEIDGEEAAFSYENALNIIDKAGGKAEDIETVCRSMRHNLFDPDVRKLYFERRPLDWESWINYAQIDVNNCQTAYANAIKIIKSTGEVGHLDGVREIMLKSDDKKVLSVYTKEFPNDWYGWYRLAHLYTDNPKLCRLYTLSSYSMALINDDEGGIETVWSEIEAANLAYGSLMRKKEKKIRAFGDKCKREIQKGKKTWADFNFYTQVKKICKW